MSDEEKNESGGKTDLVSILYIAGGIPVMALFFIVLFALANACDIPA